MNEITITNVNELTDFIQRSDLNETQLNEIILTSTGLVADLHNKSKEEVINEIKDYCEQYKNIPIQNRPLFHGLVKVTESNE